MSAQRFVILTEGNTEPLLAKTASSVIRYRTNDVVALLDSTQRGKTAGELLGVGDSIPIVATLEEAAGANTLLIGIASAGGRIPADWRPILLEAIKRRMSIVSGMHQFLADDPELAAAAAEADVELVDVRRNDERDVATGEPFRDGCLRVLTVGQDCSVGKMIVALELARALQARDHDAKFVATGQTGIMIEGDGCPVDCVVSDFVNGATEKLVRRNDGHDILLVEGQGSLAHPRYSAVTLGLLHGSRPDGMILCYELDRPHVRGMPEVELRPLSQLAAAYESAAALIHPAKIIGIAVNTRRVDDQAAAAECRRVAAEFGLPACDVLRHGPTPLVEAILELQNEV